MAFDFTRIIRTQRQSPEPSGRDEIACDVDDEFRFHIEQTERELLAQGIEPEAAQSLAQQRFGDIKRYRLECHRIARREQIMLQRANFILMIVVLIFVIGASIQMFITQRYNTLAIQAIGDQLASMSQPASPPEIRATAEIAESNKTRPVRSISPGTVTIGGAIQRPGSYQLPNAIPLTLTRALVAAGITDQPVESVRIHITRGEGVAALTETLHYADLITNPRLAPVLQPGDHVIVEVTMESAPAVDQNAARLRAENEVLRERIAQATGRQMSELVVAAITHANEHGSLPQRSSELRDVVGQYSWDKFIAPYDRTPELIAELNKMDDPWLWIDEHGSFEWHGGESTFDVDQVVLTERRGVSPARPRWVFFADGHGELLAAGGSAWRGVRLD